jgi:hypothetical protein
MNKWILGIIVTAISVPTFQSILLADTSVLRLNKYLSIIEQLGGSNGQWNLSWAPVTAVIPSTSSYRSIQLSTSSLKVPHPFEVFEVKNDVISDGYRNLVYVDWKADQLWIRRSGGLTGRIEFYGPIKLSSDGEVIRGTRSDLSGEPD